MADTQDILPGQCRQTCGVEQQVESFSYPRQDGGRPQIQCCITAEAPTPTTPATKPGAPHSQHIVPEAALPLGLVEEVVEGAAEGDEHKAKGQEAKNACGVQGQDPLPEQTW